MLLCWLSTNWCKLILSVADNDPKVAAISFLFFSDNVRLQKAQRDLEGLKSSQEAGSQRSRMLSNGEQSKAHIQVATAAANEGQRRSMYNKNNRFLVT